MMDTTLTPEATDLAAEIAAALGERESGPRAQIWRIVRVLGAGRARELLQKTLEVEERGGMLTVDGTRRRSIGGVYLRLAKEGCSKKEFFQVFGPPPWKQKEQSAAGSAPKEKRVKTPQGKTQEGMSRRGPMTDEQVANATSAMEYGEARTVKMTVIGTPKRVVEQADVVIVGLRSEKVPALPKGLPVPAPVTDYACFVARKQWAAVAAALQRDPNDVVVLEGYPYLHPKFKTGIAVAVTMATTAGLQRPKREAQGAGR
jgi:hypothetical protein